MTDISMREMLEAGVHFGHQTNRWNPKMKPYIFGARNGIYIIDLQKTVKKAREALQFVNELAGTGGAVLFVGTKRQAQEVIAEEAQRCGMNFVNQRWLGGTLTNFATIKKSLSRLRELEDTRIYRDVAELERLQTFVTEGLKRFEYGLRRKVDDEANRALVTGADEVPQEFRKLVEEYYRSLSKGKQQ